MAGWRRDGLATVHAAALARWREAMNLVGPGDVDAQIDDCAQALAVLDDVVVRGAWVDLGSGAGLPGLVLAARCPDAEVTLVDSRAKRTAFLEHVVMQAGATGVHVVRARVETLPSGAFDGVVARAFAPPEDVLCHADRLLRDGGCVVLFLQGHADPPDAPGFAVERVHDYAVDGKARRAVRLRLHGA